MLKFVFYYPNTLMHASVCCRPHSTQTQSLDQLPTCR